MHLEHLGLFERRHRRLDPRGQEQVQDLGEDPRRAQIAFQAVPLLRTDTGLFNELPLRCDERWLVGFQLSSRQLPDPSFRHVPILPQQAHPILRVDRHHGSPTRVMNDLELGPVPIWQDDLVRGHRDDAAAKMSRLLFGFHVKCRNVKGRYERPSVPQHDGERMSDGTTWHAVQRLGKLVEVRQAHLILITGLPGTGKSTLACSLARHLLVPLICKDTIKEPLLDLLGAADRPESRRLSDASFAVMFALARDCLRAGTDVILEGNFRSGEHEGALSASIRDANTSVNDAPHAGRLTQILCRTPEPVRIARLKARATDPSRHAGHRDADLTAHLAADPPADLKVALASGPAAGSSPSASDFLALPSERFVFDSDGDSTHLQALLESLEQRNRDHPHV